jgi:hypothetical protein
MIDDLWQKHKDNPVVVSKKVDRKLSLDMKKMLKHILEQAVEKKQN